MAWSRLSTAYTLRRHNIKWRSVEYAQKVLVFKARFQAWKVGLKKKKKKKKEKKKGKKKRKEKAKRVYNGQCRFPLAHPHNAPVVVQGAKPRKLLGFSNPKNLFEVKVFYI